jgi:sulfite exporter TauE/SafE
MIESELGNLSNITHVKSSLKNHSVEVEGNFGDKTLEQIAEELTMFVKPHGYTVSIERQIKEKKGSDFKIAIPIALAFAFLFVVLQKMGIVNLVSAGNVTYGTAFVIGIIASLSTCMAVVGGLVLSMSATFAKEGDPSTRLGASKVRPQLMFHIGRIVSFFILGGVIGSIGAVFTLNTSVTFILSLIIGIVMLILGINLLDIFHWAKKLQPSMPKFIAKHAHGVLKFNHTLTPLLVGIATFFLPCGFTQSMQLYTLTTGSFLQGGFTMLVFALGTLPVLALVSFSSFSIRNSSKSGIFFKTAGLIVIIFALFNLINSLVVIGLIPPLFNF